MRFQLKNVEVISETDILLDNIIGYVMKNEKDIENFFKENYRE
ncbi:Uncharacterised protein [Fusobacterium necrogenes]|uniref:Uncharacterized protein n=1 Tax=Fusobacterium necrogenes TaxID=858 RepID=A0A377GV91_9FUSO|nr:hypothetical protein [Fusobacterium necrogenes]STO30900.1 Uncharacterised protein [Fusobacterium necrogenes]